MKEEMTSTVVHGGALIPGSLTNISEQRGPGAQSRYWDRQLTYSSEDVSPQVGPYRLRERPDKHK